MAATVLAEISRQDLLNHSGDSTSTPTPSASITNVKHLSSYSWIEAPTPTIAVPGSPALWSAPVAPQRVKKDSGLIYIAQNAARHPDSPLEPLFRALYIANPSFDIRSIDVVTDRNNVRKLLSFIDPGSSRNGLETFTINVEVVKNTAIFSRTETATHEFIAPHEFKGFGHEFKKAYTTNQISGSTGHHRIISYRFGDLSFVVRYETDAYVDDGRSHYASASKEPENHSLSSMLGSLSLSSTKSPSIATPTGSKLTIKREGQVVPLESNLEIKTRVAHKPLDMREVASQLWISQTFKLVRAYHQKGMFQRPNVEDVAAVIKKWEENNQTQLRKLAVLLKKILSAVKRSDGTAVVKYDLMKDKLIVSKVERKKMLPEELYSKWNLADHSEAETNLKHGEGAGIAAKSIDKAETEAKTGSNVTGQRDTKGKEVGKRVKSVKPAPPPETLPESTSTDDKSTGSPNQEEEDLANFLKKINLGSSTAK